ncbi:cell division protein FtsK [[Actinomadura] parvosata]|uniref:cell division protein FtsK n=1 Tax=[Actinomadura] parvosata TaxID=1955412 RepID=UPI00406D1558
MSENEVAVPVPQDPEDDGEVLEGEVVDRPYAPEPENYLTQLAERRAGRSPLVPLWLKSRADALAVLKWQAEHSGYVLAYHTLRTPKYAARLLARSPAGVWRLLVELVRWQFDLEGRPARRAAVRRENAEEYLRLSQQRDARVRARLWVTLIAAITLVIAAIILAVAAPSWAHWLTLGALIAVAGIVGTPSDKPLLDRAVVPARVLKLTSDMVIDALASLGISGINQALSRGGKGVTFPAPIARDGPGWRADVELPLGVTATDIMKVRDKLASGLRRPIGCVWPEPGEEHPGRLILWVGDQEMSKVKPPRWPLAQSGRADLFREVPFGTDQRGRTVPVTLMFANMLIGAMPGMGKTFALRILALAAALDPLAELRVFELKGSGDLSPLEKLAHHYGSGQDDETAFRCLLSLREVRADLERRAKVIASLPKDLCPENKVTPELAAKRSLGLSPVVIIIDECQKLFSHEDYGDEAGKLATDIIKLGRAFGVILLLATQRPDKDSLPTGVSANVGIRFCLRVMGQTENDMVLGTSAYKNGIRATMFTKKDKGIGYLVGETDDPVIVRSYGVNSPVAERICERAYAMRKAAGTLSGMAIGKAMPPSYDLLTDVLSVIEASEKKVWNCVVVDRLADLRPEVYGTWADQDEAGKTATLTAALKPHGVSTKDMHGHTEDGRTSTRKGVEKARLIEVLERGR